MIVSPFALSLCWDVLFAYDDGADAAAAVAAAMSEFAVKAIITVIPKRFKKQFDKDVQWNIVH